MLTFYWRYTACQHFCSGTVVSSPSFLHTFCQPLSLSASRRNSISATMGKKSGGRVRVKQMGGGAKMPPNPLADLAIPSDEMIHLPTKPDSNAGFLIWPMSEKKLLFSLYESSHAMSCIVFMATSVLVISQYCFEPSILFFSSYHIRVIIISTRCRRNIHHDVQEF